MKTYEITYEITYRLKSPLGNVRKRCTVLLSDSDISSMNHAIETATTKYSLIPFGTTLKIPLRNIELIELLEATAS